MKLIIAIVQDEDASRLISTLMNEWYSVTKLATTGGFLRAGNTTLLLGGEDDRVKGALDVIERKWGDMFKQVFKTITMDNGSEFADCEGIERSALGAGSRTKTYYCHPYSSYERGSNEVTNKMIRRHIPKGTNFDEKTDEEISAIESWVNNYPRKIHGYHSAGELFEEEIRKIS